MPHDPTPCETCDFVHMDTRNKSPHYWLCVRFPRLEHMNAIAPKTWVQHDPYNRCANINLGHCPLWTARRDGQLQLRPQPKAKAETKKETAE